MRKLFAVLALMALVAACGGGRPGRPAPSRRDMGVYAFRASLQVSDETFYLRGTFEATADTVLLDLEDASCLAIPGGSRPSIGYRCEIPSSAEVSRLMFSFDRRLPAQGPSVWATVTTSERETFCQQYEKVEGGGMVCVSWEERLVTRTQQRRAQLSSLTKAR
ncbi:MAG: hypothetical protein FIA95_03205 [Gemmatimonadetes bacterium]|nr:hypothetical protein [Gemmatimonadota bacterium]